MYFKKICFDKVYGTIIIGKVAGESAEVGIDRQHKSGKCPGKPDGKREKVKV